MIFTLDERVTFPDPSLADEDGLLAIAGDLSVERLLLAYQNGIFPWYNDETPILWYSPHERFDLPGVVCSANEGSSCRSTLISIRT